MGVPFPHLLLDSPRHVFGAEGTGLFGEDDLKGEVKGEIAQLVLDLGDVACGDRLIQLEHLFDQIRAQRFAGLGRVPRATLSKIPDQFNDASKR
jgi:hypothetical protein